MNYPNNNNNRNRNQNRRRKDDIELGETFNVDRPRERKQTDEWAHHKYYYAFAYFLFFLPLFVDDSRRSRFYANQGLMVWLWFFIGNVIIYYLGYINAIAPAVMYIHWIFSVFIVLLAIYGFIATVQDKKDVRLPIIGMADFIK